MKPTDDLDVFLATMGPRKTSAASEEVAFDSDIVHGIVESAKIVGLVHAIAVRMPRAGEQKKNRAVLVAGRNQLEAARHLGLERIDCKFVDSDDETFVQPVEIAENLFRKHLPVLQRSELIYRWYELAIKNRISGQVDRKRNRGRPRVPSGKWLEFQAGVVSSDQPRLARHWSAGPETTP